MGWKLPFISRERFEDERARCLKLEAEVERLQRILIPDAHSREEAPPKHIRENLRLTEGTDFATILPIPGKVTIAKVINEANRAAMERSKTQGALGISEELATAAAQRPIVTPFRKKAVNGN